MNPEIKEKL